MAGSIWLPALLHGLGLATGGLVLWWAGGARRNLPLLLVLGLYAVLTWYTPVVNYLTGNTTLYGTDFTDRVGETLMIYALAVNALLLGYLARPTPSRRLTRVLERWEVPEDFVRRKLPLLWLVVGGIVALNLALFAVLHWPVSLHGVLYSVGVSPYLEGFTDSLLTVFILSWLTRRTGWKSLVGWSICLLLLLGFFFLINWRYRIIMTMIMLLGDYLLRRGVTWRLLASAGAAALTVILITVNRGVLFYGRYHELTLDITQFNERTVRDQTNNSQMFGVLLGYLDRPDVHHDWGYSTFGFIPLRAVPGQLFPGGKKPLPPLMEAIQRAFPPTGKAIPSAVTNVGEAYFAFGLPGVLGVMFLFGYLLRAAPPPHDGPGGGVLHRALYLLFTAWLFQYVTRGYLPQHVELAAYLLLPPAALHWWHRARRATS
ncbi:MAG: hypothetical protein WBA12_14330 [Catalinimonas sp.]